MLKFFYTPNTCALASHIALGQAGATYETVRVDFATAQQRSSDDPATIEGMKRGAPNSVAAAFALIESDMLKSPWVMGADYSICDPYLFTLAQWLEADGVDTATLPRVLDHRGRMRELPAVKRALEAERR